MHSLIPSRLDDLVTVTSLTRAVVTALRLCATITTVWALVARADCVFLTQTCRASNLLSYFTIQSNIAFVVLTIFLMIWTVIGKHETRLVTVLRAVVTSYLILSGATFAVLIVTAGLGEFEFLVPLSSKILHFVTPVYALVDFFFAPGRRRINFLLTLWVLVYPVIYAIGTVIRGRTLQWYPYVFFDPNWVGSDLGVVLYIAALGVVLLVIMCGLALVSRVPPDWGPRSARVTTPSSRRV